MHSRYRRGLSIDGETVHTGRVTRRTLLVATAALLAGAEAAQARRLTPKQARALRAAVHGRVLTPASSGYDAARVVFNRRYDHVRPPAVVQVRDSADVRAVVRWAERKPGPGQMASQVMTAPAFIATVPRRDGPVRFEKMEP